MHTAIKRDAGMPNSETSSLVMEEKQTEQLPANCWTRVILRETLVPLLLIMLTPNVVVCLTYFVIHEGSSTTRAFRTDSECFWKRAWRASCACDSFVWVAVLVLVLWAGLSVVIPFGRVYLGPPTANTGFRPTYRNGGLGYYLITVVIFFVLLAFPNLVSAWYWYKKGSAFAGTLVVLGFILCTFFMVKGHLAPSPGEHGSSGNPLFDFYWGMELYPRLGSRFDLKMWSNCRFGMMAWQLVVLVCWKAQLESSGWNWSMACSALLQTIYIAKFYLWEDGYMKSIDIILDRAGFYVCWGCICIVPTFYSSSSLYLVENAANLHWGWAVFIFCLGLAFISVNYWVDYQRQLARATDGQCQIWGRPARMVRAFYQDGTSTRESLLLASGFWGSVRHPNYLWEVLAVLGWSVPALANSLVPYLCPLFLTVLLVHRSMRDEDKCRKKYGIYWKEYCQLVKYRLIPYVF